LLLIELIGQYFTSTEIYNIEFAFLAFNCEDNMGTGRFTIDIRISKDFIGMGLL
jgi:hypothetical protein